MPLQTLLERGDANVPVFSVSGSAAPHASHIHPTYWHLCSCCTHCPRTAAHSASDMALGAKQRGTWVTGQHDSPLQYWQNAFFCVNRSVCKPSPARHRVAHSFADTAPTTAHAAQLHSCSPDDVSATCYGDMLESVCPYLLHKAGFACRNGCLNVSGALGRYERPRVVEGRRLRFTCRSPAVTTRDGLRGGTASVTSFPNVLWQEGRMSCC